MKLRELYRKALDRTPLTADEAWRLYDEAPLFELAATADRLRRETVPDPQVVTWQIDRNVNVTNVCISGCRFCNFHCKPHVFVLWGSIRFCRIICRHFFRCVCDGFLPLSGKAPFCKLP